MALNTFASGFPEIGVPQNPWGPNTVTKFGADIGVPHFRTPQSPRPKKQMSPNISSTRLDSPPKVCPTEQESCSVASPSLHEENINDDSRGPKLFFPIKGWRTCKSHGLSGLPNCRDSSSSERLHIFRRFAVGKRNTACTLT